MRKLLIGLTVLVLGVAFMVPGFASKRAIPVKPSFPYVPGVADASTKNEVVWTVPPYIELSVSEDNFTFPELKPGIDEYLAEKAVILYVKSNTDWSLSFELEGDKEVIAHLSVLLDATSGHGSAEIPVDYKLSKLREMAPGTYQVTVIYTATTE